MTDKINAAPFATKALALSAALEHAKANPYIDYTYRTEPVWNDDREVVGFHLILMDDEGYTVREIGDAEARDLLAARLVSEVKEGVRLAEMVRLTEVALEPFAAAGRSLSPQWEGHETHWRDAAPAITVEDLRTADEALRVIENAK